MILVEWERHIFENEGMSFFVWKRQKFYHDSIFIGHHK